MKDKLHLGIRFIFRDVFNEIKDYIEYYNNYRYQWHKKDDPCKIQRSSFRKFSIIVHFFKKFLNIWYILIIT